MLKQKYFLTDFFILSAEKQPIKLSWRNIEWLQTADKIVVAEYTMVTKEKNRLLKSSSHSNIQIIIVRIVIFLDGCLLAPV